MNIAEYICKYLDLYQVRFIFGYPGASILPLMDQIDKHPNLEWVLMRTESSAALAASALGKLTKNVSVCLATSGPGASNLVTGLLDAELDASPVLAITGLVPTIKHGLSHFQSVEQRKLLESSCGFNVTCKHPAQVPQLLQAAMGYILRFSRPAHIEISLDLQLTEFTEPELQSALLHFKHLHTPLKFFCPPDNAIQIVAETINAIKKVVIAVGPRAYGAGKEIEHLAEKISAPIISTFAGKGVIREDHPLYFGVFGLFGAPANASALEIIKEADAVITIGVDDLVYFLTNKNVDQIRTFIQCEPNIDYLDHQFIQQRILLGDLSEIAKELTKKLNKRQALPNKLQIKEQIKESTFVSQALFCQKLNSLIDHEDTIIAFDIGDSVVGATQFLKLKAYQTVLVSNRLGTMGFCLPALIAAKLAKPDHLVLGIVGDGGLQMVLSELLTAAQCQLNIMIFVFCNDVLQRVAAQQKTLFGTKILNPDFEQLAKSCHIEGINITNNKDIDEKLKLAFSIKNGPVLVSVKTDPNVYAPMVSWDAG